MGPRATPEPRPYWHVDAKWVFGLLLCGLLSVLLLVSALASATSERVAVDVMSVALAVAYSPDGIDDPTEVEEFRARLATAEAGIRPIPSLAITVTAADAEGTPRQVRVRFMRKLAEPMYRGGPEAFGALAEDPAQRAQLSSSAAGLGILNARTHGRLVLASFALAAICALAAVPVVLFSSRFGRLASPGIALLVAGMPGALLLSFLRLVLAREPPPAPSAGSAFAMASYVAAYALPPAVAAAHLAYLIATTAGTLLVAISAAGGVLIRLRGSRASAEPPSPAG